jgi:deoxyadenosine/deoxycytidine kinase
MNKYILICGATGVGKSTIAALISKRIDYQFISEPNEINPYLPKAYFDNSGLYFHSQLFFLLQFLKIHEGIDKSETKIVQERSLFEAYEIFCKLFHLQKKISDDEFRMLKEIYQILLDKTNRIPDVIVYVTSDISNIISRIHKRGRSFEVKIDSDFIEKQLELYELWLNQIGGNCKIVRFNNDNETIDIQRLIEEI